MIINDNRALKNGDNIFKARVVNSYIQFNGMVNNVALTVSGLTETSPLNLYYKTSNGTQKFVFSSNWAGAYLDTPGDTSYKQFFFSGNLDAVTEIAFQNYNYWQGSYFYRGDLIELMKQFPNLTYFNAAYTTNYQQSTFNQDITDAEFPINLKGFIISDGTLSGDITTIKNFNKIEMLNMFYCPISGNLHDINFNDLKNLEVGNLNNLSCNLELLINDNPNLKHLGVDYCPQFYGDLTNVDVSNLDFIRLMVYDAYNLTGDISNWEFNTGLTYFVLYNQNIDGDLTNWDFSDTKLTSFTLYNMSSQLAKLHGDLSGWQLPDTLSSISIYYVSGITALPTDFSNTNLSGLYVYGIKSEQNLTDIDFGSKITSITLYDTPIRGDIGTYVIPPTMTVFQMYIGVLSGNCANITCPSGLTNLYLVGNKITGNFNDMVFPDALNYLGMSNNNMVLDMTSKVFHTKNIVQLEIGGLTAVTGSFGNFINDGALTYLSLAGSKMNADISALKVNNLTGLRLENCEGMYGDITNWLSGATSLTTLSLYDNPLLSGDCGSWNIDNVSDLNINSTNFTGRLKHSNPYYFYAQNTKITSNIAEDFNLVNRAFYFGAGNSMMTGHLSGVSLNMSIYYFEVHSNPNIYGSNEFTNYIFTNRKNFNYGWVSFNYHSIGDSPTGIDRELGDVGTYTGDYNDLTEAEVNNLAIGIDYDGQGTNVPWNSLQKVWWMTNAKISSTVPNNRYVNFSISL